MIIVYTPADGEPEQYDARTLLASEAAIVARTIEKTWPEIRDGLGEEDLDSMRGVVWVLKKRSNLQLRFGQFDPGVDECITRYDKREIENYVQNAFTEGSKNPEVTPEMVAQALRAVPAAALDPEHARAFIAELAEGPKDPGPTETAAGGTSTSSGSSTSDSSPTSSTSDPGTSMP